MNIPDSNNLLHYFEEEYNSLHSSFNHFDTAIDNIFNSLDDIKTSNEAFKLALDEIRSSIANLNYLNLSNVLDVLSQRIEDLTTIINSFYYKFNYIQKQSSDFSHHLSLYFRDFKD